MLAAPFRPGETVRIRDQRWTVTAPSGPVLHVRGCDAGNRGAAAAFLQAIERIDRLPAPSVRIVTPSRWRRDVRALLAGASAHDTLIAAPGARLEVLPYQLEPALAVVRGVGVRLLVADEVGLGKTVEAGLIVAELLARSRDARILIVAPAGLREQWQAELGHRFGIDAALIDSSVLAAPDARLLASGNPWTAAAVGIASVDFVKRPEIIRSLESIVWDLVVLDEAHGLSGRTDRAQAARAIAERARIVVMLTATPHPGDDAAFERLTQVGNLEQRFPLVVFRRTRDDAGLAGARRTAWLRVRPSPAERRMHDALLRYARTVWGERGTGEPAARLAMTVLVKRACSGAASLAHSLERRLRLLATAPTSASQLQLPLAGDDQDDDVLAAPGMSDAAAERRILAELECLARLAALAETKPALLIRLLRRARQPAIVFTEYRDTLSTLAEALASFSPVLLHGGLPMAERRAAVDGFTRGAAVLLLATDAASEGLNLQARCRIVVNLELPWTPLRLEQRIGRVERIGQSRPVHAIHLVAAGTEEERTVERLLRATRRIERAVASLRAPAVRERDVSAALFGEVEEHAVAEPTSGTAVEFITPDLRHTAATEATRILQVRALAPASPRPPSGRPIVTRRPAHRLPFTACCVYRFILADSSDEFVAEWLLAFAVHRPCWTDETGLRARLAAIESTLLPEVQARYQQVHTTFTAGRAAFVGAAIDREQAILRTLIGRQSRLAVRLLQPGLFDHRAERAAAAQRAIRRDAAERCHERLRALRRIATATTGGHSLLCAIVTG